MLGWHPRATTGNCHEHFDHEPGWGGGCPGPAMVSIPTLWVVFVVNFLALGMVWTYVVRNYPGFGAARFWAAGAYLGTAGAMVSMLRGSVDPLIPIVLGNGLLLFACWLGAMGMLRFYDQPVSWARSLLLTALSVAGLAIFTVWD